MKKMLIASILLLTAMSITQVNGIEIEGFSFRAPWTPDKSDVPSPQKGEIVYEFNTDTFWGYAGSSWQNLQQGGSNNLSLANYSSSQSVSLADDVIIANASSGAIDLTLPVSSGAVQGKVFYFKKVDSSFNSVTINANGSEVIDGLSAVSLRTHNESIELVSSGTGWHVINRTIDSRAMAYVPVFYAFGSTSSTNFNYSRVGRYIKIQGQFTPNAPTSAEARIGLPVGLVVSSAVTNNTVVGAAATQWTGETRQLHVLAAGGGTYVTIGRHDTTGGLSSHNANAFTSPLAAVSVDFMVPIDGWEN